MENMNGKNGQNGARVRAHVVDAEFEVLIFI